MVDYENRSYESVTDIRNKNKVDKLFKLIPEDVNTVIDIGCGNGLITNELGKHYDVLGVDINESKLKFVETNKLKSSCDSIPKPDKSFDMVFSSEMIEHLDDDLFNRTMNEFDRLSKKYILITIPNKEPLHKLVVKCKNCHKLYHKNGHLRSFDTNSVKSLHPNWEVITTEEFGGNVRNYHKSLASLKHKLTPADSWIPNYWIKNQGVNYHFCIHCIHKNELKYRFHPISFALDTLNIMTTGKSKSHLLALFKKRQ
ncbi:class I SAM-dependent methyltransferase [Fulvivirga sp. RKSG066]|uniref:class I SAM-dependent methyltransferase n=1 Tax=Fulvivirga aurantia TaxID=2529383 RepID=UPI001FE88801|nr:class I SAM-dependent methyltransferase [Fulvivirga aurantia]MTI22749.1 class I SAM-dependent methyltransferase [Fulvivirga aurantia]